MKYFYLLMIITSLIGINAVLDEWIADRLQRFVNHKIHSWIVGFIFFMMTIGYGYMADMTPKEVIATWPVLLAIRWILHDLVLNYVRKREWDYLGTGENAAALDKWLGRQKYHPMVYKVIFLGFMVILSLIIKNTYWFESLWASLINLF